MPKFFIYAYLCLNCRCSRRQGILTCKPYLEEPILKPKPFENVGTRTLFKNILEIRIPIDYLVCLLCSMFTIYEVPLKISGARPWI